MLAARATDRKTMKALLSIAITLPLLACTATVPEHAASANQAAPASQVAQNSQNAREPRLVCTREIPTGTMMAVTRCRNIDDMATRTQSDREQSERIQTTVPDSVLGR
jgi:hypothetical protein